MSDQRPSRRLLLLLPPVLLVLLVPCFFWRETFGRQTLGDQDAVFWFFPAYRLVAEQLRTFHWPGWNQYLFGGMPLFAAWQAGVLDPLNWLYILFGVTSRTLTLVQELSFALAALSTFVYTRSLSMGRRASIIAAVIYAFGGYMVARTLYPGLLHVTALAPLAVFFVERCFRRSSEHGGFPASVGGALVIAWQIFAGHPQPLVYSCLLAACYALFSVLFRGPLRKGVRLRFIGHCVVMFAGGAALSAVQILPALEFARESVRQQWPYEMFTLHSLHPISLVGALFPYFHGAGKTIYHVPYWGTYWHHNEAAIYLGALAISLAVTGAVAAWRVRYRVGVFWSAVALLAMLLSLGKYAGPVAWVLYRVPLIGSFRSPNRHWMEVALAVAVLSGYAIDRFLHDEERGLGRVAVIASGALAVFALAVGGLVLLWRNAAEALIRSLPDLSYLPNGFLSLAGAEFWIPMSLGVLAFVVLAIFTLSRRRTRWYWALLVLMLVDFNLYATFAPIGNPNRLEKLIGTAMPREVAQAPGELQAYRSHLLLNPAAGEFSPLLFSGQEMVSGYDPLLSARYKVFSGIDEAGRSNLPSMLALEDRTLDMLNVRYVMVAPTFPVLKEPVRWRELDTRSPVDAYRDFAVFENLRVLPRAWLAVRVESLAEYDQLRLIRGEVSGRSFDPREVALMTPEDATRLDMRLGESHGGTSKPGEVAILHREMGRMVLEAETTHAAMLVLSEVLTPGWHASVDGSEAEIWRVDYVLRGIALQPGKHRIEVWYSPGSLKTGATISIVAGLGLLGLCIWSRHVAR
jgi:hypothetical protein